jgi:HEAT repeat protein
MAARTPIRLLGVALLGVLLAAAPAPGQPPPAKIGPILADMVARGPQFRPHGLHALGLEGLTAVLDWLLPDTARPQVLDVPDNAIAALVAQLGHKSYRVRESATEKLHELGIVAQPALVEATHSADAEVSWRAAGILRTWEAERNQDVSRYLPGFAVYLSGIHDKQRLQELGRRTRLVLDGGMCSGGKIQVVRMCIVALSRPAKDEYTDVLVPLLKHQDVQVAVFLTQTVGATALEVPGNYPALLLEALQSDRSEVVGSAINLTLQSGDSARAAEVQRRLIAVFHGNDQRLKLQACRPLIHVFNNEEAVDFILEQLRNAKEKSRQYEAVAMLADPRNQKKTIHPKLLKALPPLIESSDQNLRVTLINALGTYAGEDVVKVLIPLLGDQRVHMSREIGQRLLGQPDRAMVRRLLEEAAKNDPNEKVRQEAAALLQQAQHTSPPATIPRPSRRGRLVLPQPLPPPDGDDPFG